MYHSTFVIMNIVEHRPPLVSIFPKTVQIRKNKTQLRISYNAYGIIGAWKHHKYLSMIRNPSLFPLYDMERLIKQYSNDTLYENSHSSN